MTVEPAPQPPRLAYVTNTGVPSTKANTKQSFAMCAALAGAGLHVALVHPERRATAPLPGVDPFTFYGTPRSFQTLPVRCIDSGWLSRVRPTWWFTLLSRSFGRSLVRSLAIQQVDVVYTRDHNSLPTLLRARQRGWLRAPIIFEVHRVYREAPSFLPHVDALVVINDYLRRAYAEEFGFDAARICVAHDGFEPREYAHLPAYRYESKSTWRVVYTGNLFKWKGVYTLVDSLEHLPASVTLRIVGGSPETLAPFSRYVAKRPWSERVEIMGFVAPTEIPAVLADADVLVLPNSAHDPLSYSTSPMKLFEYMAAQRPIVASRLPSLEEVLQDGHNAILCAPDDPRDLAEKIRQAVSRDQAAYVQQALADVQQYSWPARARQIAAFLRGLGLLRATEQPAAVAADPAATTQEAR